MTNLESLKAKAMAATPGPWVARKREIVGDIRANSAICVGRVTPGSENNTPFIAAASPDVVLGLIERIERMTEALEFYADKDAWQYWTVKRHGAKPGKSISDVMHDDGDRAREALKAGE